MNDKKLDKKQNEIDEDEYIDDFYQYNTCDWCGRFPIYYSDEAFELCENCHDQMFGI